MKEQKASNTKDSFRGAGRGKKSKTGILSLPDIRMHLKLTVIQSSAELAEDRLTEQRVLETAPPMCGSVMHSRCGTADPGKRMEHLTM